MAEQLRVFVSHSHQDNAFCQQIVQALRDAGADVWYDEHNMSSGRLGPTIERELRARKVFVVILTPAALSSQWVEDETRWAYGLLRKDPSRLMLPITAATIVEDDIWLFLQDFKRIEDPGRIPYSVEDAASRLVRALGLTPRGKVPTPVAPQPTEDVYDLLTRGKALMAQTQYAEALPIFERATQLAPDSFDAWAGLGFILGESSTGRHGGEIAAYDRALALDERQAWLWNNKGIALDDLGRSQEALDVYDRALALDSADAEIWNNKANILNKLRRFEEARSAIDHALELDPDSALAWCTKGEIQNAQARISAALNCFERSLTLDSEFADAWYGKSLALRSLGRTAEAEAAEQRARELGWKE